MAPPGGRVDPTDVLPAGVCVPPPPPPSSRFQSTPPHPDRWDTTLFAGGPLWAMEWCPAPDDSADRQYVALACHREMDDEHCVNQTYGGDALVQLWDVGRLDSISGCGSSGNIGWRGGCRTCTASHSL